MKPLAIVLASAALAIGVMTDGVAYADESRFWPNDIRTLFVIAKSDNRDEVQYGIHLDKDCMPIGDAPIYGYWRQYERGANVTEDLGMLDKTVYGIKGQWVRKRTPDESKVLMQLKADARGIAIITHKRDGKCTHETVATINNQPGRLEKVFVHIPGFLKVDWVELRGSVNNKPVVERVVVNRGL